MDERTGLRQGDVLLLPIAKSPVQLTEKRRVEPEDGRLIVARGEVTGHHHSFAHDRGATMYLDDGSGGGRGGGSRLFLEVTEPTPLEHQEHRALLVEPGLWEVRRQRTATMLGASRMVAD